MGLPASGWWSGDCNSLGRKTLRSPKKANDHICLCESTGSLASDWWNGDCNSLGQKTLRSLKRRKWLYLVSACQQACLPPVEEVETAIVSVERYWGLRKEQMTTFVFACQRARLPLVDDMDTKVVLVNKHWVFDKGCRQPCWSLCVIGLDCLWMMIWRLK